MDLEKSDWHIICLGKNNKCDVCVYMSLEKKSFHHNNFIMVASSGIMDRYGTLIDPTFLKKRNLSVTHVPMPDVQQYNSSREREKHYWSDHSQALHW